MQRAFAVLAGLLLVTAVAVTATSGLAAPAGPTYTVAQAHAAILRAPRAWTGRIMRLRATAYPMAGTSCPMTQPWCSAVMLTDGATPPNDGVTMVAIHATPNLWWSFVRRLPFGDRLLPDQASMAWGRPAIYQVRFIAQTFTLCTAPCLQTQVLDLSN